LSARLGILILAAAAFCNFATIARAEPSIRSVDGAWQLRCDESPNSQPQCGLTQAVTAKDRDNVGLTIVVLKTADGRALIMRVFAPVGVLLSSGLGVRVDDADLGRVAFVRCWTSGCVAEFIIDNSFLEKLKTGNEVMFIIYLSPERGVGIPVSLAGFSEAFQRLP
jgi:invasion protein IalB